MKICENGKLVEVDDKYFNDQIETVENTQDDKTTVLAEGLANASSIKEINKVAKSLLND